ncbi:ribonuclease HII [Owenweeksia hongkongensis DSM 17368]|uniref:Ribonuclease HII n=1 Tax=Owenweeksia hongkongensis (strain DSM 17368 / CIP 108786 / JCM 12287 / NRRL B-23963 / UST20020801) TaxID=926562 RepID=G8R1Q2_OWEHD|nr:ribonuclease HII [Owenweeksia hongkongensis]AEV32828.1 ribonuclease HII [Owenweeksia hongkongensis DSM 17368]
MPRLLNCHTKGLIEAGCDEAGRGCLAGPVTAAAVILPPNFRHKLLNDSKKMTEAHREELRSIIEEKALAWAVASVTHEEIDKINILNASFLAMHRAVEQLKIVPQALLIDGNRFNAYPNIAHHCIIKGDGKFKSIAAASVLAKTHRDEYMAKLAEEFPQYGWKKNKGYPTMDHRAAIEKYGTTPYHRQSFRLLARQVKLEF